MTTRPRRGLALVAAGLVLLATSATGCGEDPTEIVVIVDAELIVPRELDEVALVAEGPAGVPQSTTATLVGTTAPTLPLTLVLAPGSDRDGPVVVSVTGRRAHADVTTARVETSFVRGERHMLRIVLRRACLGCTDPGGCARPACAATRAPGESLPTWPGSVPAFDELCNERDDDGDGTLDDGVALDTDAQCGRCDHACPATESCLGSACTNDFVAIAAGNGATCAVRASGAVACWGGPQNEGTLGDGCPGGTFSASPIAVRDIADAVDVSVGSDFACARRRTGAVSCWGDSGVAGRAGDGTTVSPLCTPAAAAGLTSMTSVTAGSQNGCATHTDGSLWCWGTNDAGQLGNGTVGSSIEVGAARSPVLVPAISATTRAAIGRYHVCAITSAGGVSCWGHDDVGQLGDGGTTSRATPPPPMPLDAIAIDSSSEHVCIADRRGGVSCWGANAMGQLGDGTTTPRRSPVAVTLDEPATDVAVGEAHSCALLRSGRVECWGANDVGELGREGVDHAVTPAEVRLPSAATSIAAAAQHTCAVLRGGEAYCWGSNEGGRLGAGLAVMRSFVPVRVAD